MMRISNKETESLNLQLKCISCFSEREARSNIVFSKVYSEKFVDQPFFNKNMVEQFVHFPYMPRSKDQVCKNCGNTNVVYFEPRTECEDLEMRLCFICTKCKFYWR